MTRSWLAGLLGVVAVVAVAVLVTARQPVGHEEGAVAYDTAFEEPARTAPAAPEAAAVPPVPPEAEQVGPIAFTLVTTWESASAGRRTIDQQVTRARDRAHLRVDGGRREWFFQRNPVYPDRVSAWLVDHEARQILLHDESSLRTTLRIRGWVDVLTMRFDPAALEALTDTGQRREVAGETFRLFRAPQSPPTGVVEVWWSDGILLPLELVTRESADVTATARVHGLSTAVDVSVLTSPQQRFPDYRVMDAVDAGEHR
jgi:hypothetical protein